MKNRSTLVLALLAIAWQGGRAAAQEADKAGAVTDAPAAASPAMTASPQLPCFDPCCCQPSCDPCGSGGLRGGYGLYILKPHWSNNPAFRSAVDNGNGLTTADVDFGWDYQAANALWLGAVNDCGFGGRVRWFFFDQSSKSIRLNSPAGGNAIRTAAPLGLNIDFDEDNGFTADFESDLKMNVWDFEAMQEVNCCRWSILISGGIRYAHIAQNYKVFGVDSDNPDTSVLISGHNFNGAGPTGSLTIRRNLGCTNLAVFAMGRGSLLFGRSIQQSNLVLVEDNIATTNSSASAAWDKFVPVAELEIGIDWARHVGRSVAFFEIGIAAQSWFGIGNAANNEILGNAGGNTDEVSDNKSTLGLFGIKLAAGVGF